MTFQDKPTFLNIFVLGNEAAFLIFDRQTTRVKDVIWVPHGFSAAE